MRISGLNYSMPEIADVIIAITDGKSTDSFEYQMTLSIAWNIDL